MHYQKNTLAVQWLGLHASTAGGTGLIPGQGTKILHAAWHGQKKTPNAPTTQNKQTNKQKKNR